MYVLNIIIDPRMGLLRCILLITLLGAKTTKYTVNFIELKDEIKMIANLIIDYLPQTLDPNQRLLEYKK